jgi:hypothetical protein
LTADLGRGLDLELPAKVTPAKVTSAKVTGIGALTGRAGGFPPADAGDEVGLKAAAHERTGVGLVALRGALKCGRTVALKCDARS